VVDLTPLVKRKFAHLLVIMVVVNMIEMVALAANVKQSITISVYKSNVTIQ
jgi:hypothetical protein